MERERKYSLNEVNDLIEKLKKKKRLKTKTSTNNTNNTNIKTEYLENKIIKKENINLQNNNEKNNIDNINIKEKSKNVNNSYNQNLKNDIIINKNNFINKEKEEKIKTSYKNINEFENYKNINKKENKNLKNIINKNNSNTSNYNENKNIGNNLKLPILNTENVELNRGKENIKNRNIKNNINLIKDANISLDNNFDKKRDDIDIDKTKNKNEEISLLKNIYDSFSHSLNLKSKENVFDINIINEELEILDLDYDQSLKRKNIIITNNNINFNKENIIGNNFDKIIDNNLINNKDNIIIEKSNCIKYINKFNISKDYLINSENSNKITLTNIYHLLYNEIDYQLYKNYFPVSYDNNIDLSKYNNLLSLMTNNKETRDPITYIVAELLQFIFMNNINLEQANVLKNNNIKNKILDILFTFIKKCYNKNDNLNIVNSGVLFNILNNDTINNNLIEINIMEFNPIDFILHLYNNNILNKNNNNIIIYFYFLLLNIKENSDNNNLNNQLEQIFNNFEICLYIILKFFKNEIEIKNICKILVNSLYPKMKFCQYVILKIIEGEHDILNEKFYAKLFTSFLNFVSIEKLMIADFYNLILFTINSEVKKIFAKSSILIKFKYSLLKEKYEENQNDILLKQKIFENISQFGKISKNIYFSNYIKDEFSNIQNYNDDNKINFENNIKQNELKKENNNIINDNNDNGFLSSIKMVFGLGTNDSETGDIFEGEKEKIQIYNDKNN